MKRGGPKNIVASVQARLVERSRELGVEHQLTLARFGGERLLYRLSKSPFKDRFVLKGAALLLMWLGEPIRPTKDVDLLGFGDTSAEALKRVFVELCAIESRDDGLTFLPNSVHVEAIREDQEYGGMRVKLMAMLGNVRIPLQVDVGAGDAVVPAHDDRARVHERPAPPRPAACTTTRVPARDLNCREDRGDGAARAGEQPDEGFLRYPSTRGYANVRW